MCCKDTSDCTRRITAAPANANLEVSRGSEISSDGCCQTVASVDGSSSRGWSCSRLVYGSYLFSCAAEYYAPSAARRTGAGLISAARAFSRFSALLADLRPDLSVQLIFKGKFFCVWLFIIYDLLLSFSFPLLLVFYKRTAPHWSEEHELLLRHNGRFLVVSAWQEVTLFGPSIAQNKDFLFMSGST